MQQKCEAVIPDLTDESFGKLLTGNECTETTTTARHDLRIELITTEDKSNTLGFSFDLNILY